MMQDMNMRPIEGVTVKLPGNTVCPRHEYVERAAGEARISAADEFVPRPDPAPRRRVDGKPFLELGTEITMLAAISHGASYNYDATIYKFA